MACLQVFNLKCNLHLSPLMRATCPAYLTLLDVAILIVSDGKYKL